MTDHEPLSFTVSPYDDAPVEESSGPAKQFSIVAAIPAGLWLVAAVIAVLANFLLVYRIHYHADFGDGQPMQDLSFGFNGWGQFRALHVPGPDGFGSFGSGARWGWAFSGCAALLLVAAVWSVVRPRFRLRLFGPSELVLAGLFGLLGSIVGLLLSFQPTRHQISLQPDSPSTFRWGRCWQVELVALAIGLLGWVWYRRQSEPVVLSEPTDVSQIDPQSTDAQTENWFDEARDRPGTPTDPGPSPW